MVTPRPRNNLLAIPRAWLSQCDQKWKKIWIHLHECGPQNNNKRKPPVKASNKTFLSSNRGHCYTIANTRLYQHPMASCQHWRWLSPSSKSLLKNRCSLKKKNGSLSQENDNVEFASTLCCCRVNILIVKYNIQHFPSPHPIKKIGFIIGAVHACLHVKDVRLAYWTEHTASWLHSEFNLSVSRLVCS